MYVLLAPFGDLDTRSSEADLLDPQNVFFWISMILGLSIVWNAVPRFASSMRLTLT